MTSKVWLWVEGGLAVKDFMPLPHNRHDGLMCSVSVWKNQHCEKKKKSICFFSVLSHHGKILSHNTQTHNHCIFLKGVKKQQPSSVNVWSSKLSSLL